MSRDIRCQAYNQYLECCLAQATHECVDAKGLHWYACAKPLHWTKTGSHDVRVTEMASGRVVDSAPPLRPSK